MRKNAIVRATPSARNAFNILQTDIGRPLREVMETLSTRERKVTDKEGREYSLRVRPYRTTDNKIDGAVITLVDIDGKNECNAGKTPNRGKQVWPRK